MDRVSALLGETLNAATPILQKHLAEGGRIAFAFSGGRDSLAVLHLLREWWNDIAIYHCDTGDAFPEVESIVRRVEGLVPNFQTVHGNVQSVWKEHGWPSDIVPTRSTPLGRSRYGLNNTPILDRMSCCYLTYMQPTFEAMVADGATLIIRGQRADENAAPFTSSGTRIGSQEFLYPIESWSAEDVSSYLSSINIRPATFYERGLPTTLDCMHCTGWWEYRQGAYLKKYHPAQHKEYVRRITLIKSAIADEMNNCEV